LKYFGEQKFSPAGRVFFRHFSNPFVIVKMEREVFPTRFQELCPTRVSELVLEKI
jgi:hypothetical protein